MTALRKKSATAKVAHSAKVKASPRASFARSSGLPRRFGKCTHPVKTLVPELTAEKFALLCNGLGVSESECMRDLLMKFVHGKDEMQRLRSQYLDALDGIGTESVLERFVR